MTLRAPENPHTRRLSCGVWLALWAACSGVVSAFLAQPRSTPLQEDEIYWIGSAYYFDLAFVRHDWRHSD